ncbi:unnamed protein product, partial [Symbiodinium necroappetens]
AGALWNMLKSRDMLPMNAHGVSQSNCNIFYALGHELCGGEQDEHSIARVLYNTNKSAKNMAGVIVGGKAWGSLRKHYGGSFETARAATQEDQVLKDSNAKAFCVSRNRYSFNYIAFEQLARPPSTARGLINQYLRAANIQPGGPSDLAHGTNVDHAASPTDSARASRKTSSGSVEDEEHYDANLVFKSTLRKTVEPSAWSRAKGLAGMDIRDVTVAHLSRRGMEEYGLRPLSHGRFTGIILTRNVAETVLLSQIQKRLREDNIDVDATSEAIYKFEDLKPPDKVKEATNFVTPLVEEIFLAMKPWTQVENYGKNSEQDNQVAQRTQELEEEAAKYKQRLKSAGMEVTPTKVLPLQPPPSGPSHSQQTPSPHPPPDSAEEDPPLKRRRLQRGDRKKQYEKLLEEPFNVIKQSGQQPPTSMTSIKTWVINLKKPMPADKHRSWTSTSSKSTACLKKASTPRPAAATKQLQDRLREKGVVPELYTFSRFEQPCAVYVKLKFPKLNHSGYPEISKDTSFCYVGSTNLTVAKREYNRVAKLKQLKQLKLPKTEIAIRYWHDKQNCELFSTLLLSQHQEYIDAWAGEHCLIQRWQTKLNYPFVTKELVKKAHGLVPTRQQPHLQQPPDTLAKQLFKKIRRRRQGQKQRLVNILPKQAQFWKLLYAISSDTKQEYDASRELRSGKHDNETVTLLYRLANHMEQPWRSKARARLRRVLTFRNATVPKHNLPLKIPFLAHNDFKKNVQEFVSKLIRRHRHVLTPYHLPTKTIQEMPRPALNKDKWLLVWKRLTFTSPTSAHPSQMWVHATLSSRPKDVYVTKFSISSRSGSSTIYSTTTTASSRTSRPFSKSSGSDMKTSSGTNIDSHTHRLIKHLISALPRNYIIHNEDHANTHLMIYCPNVYNQAAVNTWLDKKTFLLLDKSPEDIKADMERQTPAAVRKHYKKLLDYNNPIPYGYIMMKRKKQWSKGRTIIAYSNTCVGRLLRVAALALQQMLKATWPNHFGNIATPQLWQEVHELLQANEEQPERELIFLNHDLVGFVNSIPQADIIQSVRYLIAEFSQHNNDILLIITWLRLFGQHVASAHLADQLWIRRYVDNRAIIVDKDVLHTNPYIWQLASLQFYKKPVQLEDENCDDFLGFRIDANNSQVSYSYILHSQPWRYRLPQSAGSRKLRLSGYHSRRHMIESTVFPQSLAQQQLQALDDLYFKLGFRDLAEGKQLSKKPREDVELTDVDTDSDMDLQPVRLPHGLPLDEPPPCLPLSNLTEVEQVCQQHLSNGHIPMSVFPWLVQKLPSELLRASALTHRGTPPMVFTSGAYYHAGSVGIRTNTRKYPWTSALLAHMVRACTHTNFSTVSLLHNVNMTTHVDKYNQPGSTNVLVPLSPFRRGELWGFEDQGPDLSPKGQHQGRNHPVRLPGVEFDPFTKHATCPWKDDRLVLSAYTPLRTNRLELSDIDHLVSLGFNL